MQKIHLMIYDKKTKILQKIFKKSKKFFYKVLTMNICSVTIQNTRTNVWFAEGVCNDFIISRNK